MPEVLTEKPADTAEPVDTTTIESTTKEHGEAHLADGTLLEEMKKAVRQSAFAFFVIDQAKLLKSALLTFFFVLGVLVKKS
jgi:hypothetical protein